MLIHAGQFVSATMCEGAHGSQKRAGFPGARGTGSCESPDIWAGIEFKYSGRTANALKL